MKAIFTIIALFALSLVGCDHHHSHDQPVIVNQAPSQPPHVCPPGPHPHLDIHHDHHHHTDDG